jgi:DNA-binding beta-propeller fold protein YncE
VVSGRITGETTMKPFISFVLLASLHLGSANWAQAQAQLVIEAKILLGEVKGRIDHLAVDLGRHRLFVAELGNDSVGVVDLDQRKVIHVIAGLKAPQGIAHEASTDTLYVANGGDGTVRMFQATDFASLGRIDLGDDADNIRLDAATKQLFIGYGSGALAVIDPVNRKKIADIVLMAHPESFQLDNGTPRIFVNLPDKQTISVVDRKAGREIATWPTGNGTHFAMALDHESKRLLVSFRNPPKLGVFDMGSGSAVTSVETCRDVDDMFMDAKRRRLYVSCGEGFVDVLDTTSSAYARLARITTLPGARTSLFVPEMDRFFVAARAGAEQPAAVWVFRPTP